MGKAPKKTGKGRLGKYYKLAKEQRNRARSAFKLIQLNKKYFFLESAQCCIDLCAAHGGWLHVVRKVPVNSLIVGVDLAPIKPIPRVTTFAADITTAHCRNLIRNEFKDWKADVVLHDGAPNVGTAWKQDAYAQSGFILISSKLAVEFLMKGGTSVTKVFRNRVRTETPQAQSLREWIYSEQPEGPQVRTTSSLLTATRATRACAPSPTTRPVQVRKSLLYHVARST